MILTFMNKYRDFGLLILRLGLGGMFLFHGLPKLLGGPEMWTKLGTAMVYLGIHFLPTFWGFLAACSETLGGLCLILGLLFRPACLFLLFTMIVAASSHVGRGQGLGGASHAIEDGIVFLSLILIGAGRYSLDEQFKPFRGSNS